MQNDTVYIVDDDHDVRKALTRSLSQAGFYAQTFSSADEFLAEAELNRPCCLVLDVRMPGMSGLDLQQSLTDKGHQIPIIFITGHGDIPMSVRAIKQGAFEFLEKPYQVEDLLDKIQLAIELGRKLFSEQSEKALVADRYETLTGREKQVLKILVNDAANASNKTIARELNISHRTVDDHRAKVMRKMQAGSLVELVEMINLAGVFLLDS